MVLATGILTAANATGQLIFLPLLAWLTSAYGWRYAVGAVVGVSLVIVLPLAALLIRDRPASIGVRAFGATRGRRALSRCDRQPVSHGDRRRPRVRVRVAHVLAPERELLHLRRDDERADRHASDPGRGRSRDHRGRGRGAARDDRRLRSHRDAHVGISHRSLRPAGAARLVLRAPRPLAARACRS